MKYEVGDKVKIRKDLDSDKIYDGWDCSEEMAQCGGMIATIVKCCDDSYKIDIEDNFYNWTDGMFEDPDKLFESEIVEHNDKKAQTVDIGYCLDYCGHRVIQNVYYGGYAHDHDHVFCTTVDGANQYTLPINSIDFIIPHEN